MMNEKYEDIPKDDELKEEFIQRNNDNLSFNRLYICGILLLFLILTFKMPNKDNLKIELKEELKKELKSELKVELKEELKKELKVELKEELKSELKSELKEELKKDYQEELKNQLDKNLKISEQNLIKKFENKIEESQIKYELNFENKLKKYLKENNNIVKEEAKVENISNTKVCMCIIGKKENLYAKEFVNYYKNLGYNHIFIYDNNDVNDEKFEDVLRQEILDNFVTIIDYRGYRGKINRPQFDAYRDCYSKYSSEYDWLSFYDFDEFLYLRENKNIQEFLDQDKFKKCIDIKINWIVYSDNDLIYYEDKPIQERFTTPLINDTENKHIKSTVRGHLKNNYWSKMWNPHSSTGNYASCTATGSKTDSNSPFHTPPNFEGAFIKHYATKTIEEFLGKIRRGRSDLKVTFNKELWKDRINYFFGRNKKTKEKLDYIKKELNMSFS